MMQTHPGGGMSLMDAAVIRTVPVVIVIRLTHGCLQGGALS